MGDPQFKISNARAEELLSEIQSDLLEFGRGYKCYAIRKKVTFKAPFNNERYVTEILEDYCLSYNDILDLGLEDNERYEETTLLKLYNTAKEEASIV